MLLAETFPLLNFDTPHTAYKILPHLYAPSPNKILEYMVKWFYAFPGAHASMGILYATANPATLGW